MQILGESRARGDVGKVWIRLGELVTRAKRVRIELTWEGVCSGGSVAMLRVC